MSEEKLETCAGGAEEGDVEEEDVSASDEAGVINAFTGTPASFPWLSISTRTNI